MATLDVPDIASCQEMRSEDVLGADQKKSRTLVVLLHGSAGSPSGMAHVEEAIKTCIKDATVVVPQLPLGLLSTVNLVAVVAKLLETVDEEWRKASYAKMILVGHSVGALLARKLYVAACGGVDQAPLEGELHSNCVTQRPWACAIDRLVLLAGMNNGWSLDYHQRLSRVIQLSVGVLLGRVHHFLTRRWPVIFSVRRGAPFLTQLRVQWIYMRRFATKRGIGNAPVIQLLGTIDDLVSPRDNIDLVTGHDFYFADVPHSGHANVTLMDSSANGLLRADVFKTALTKDETGLKDWSVPVSDVTPITIDNEVEEVVFVMHGIRDEGFWTDKIARAVVREGRKSGKKIARETSTYGYFGMLPFLSPWKRREKVEWLMNRYAEAIARYPHADKFHYVGHSNGTYLLAKSIQDYPCCQFDRVVFAGSVVRTQYDWISRMRESPPQVREVLNYAATSDWVVAYFPNFMEILGIQDLGGAGHRGFAQGSVNIESKGRLVNIEYVIGKHAAALDEDNWDAIAKFILGGEIPSVPLCGVKTSPSHTPLVAFFGKYPVLIWLFILMLLAIVPSLLGYAYWFSHWREWVVTSLMIGYCASVWYIVNRV
jgi:alpha-beta hydrolase superfamily lysophospholipase